MDPSAILVWHRRDLRLNDHPALAAACASGRPVIPVFIDDDQARGLGAAARMRLGLSVARLRADYAAIGARLICRRGSAPEVLRALCAQTGARALWWSRLYDADGREAGAAVKAAFAASEIETRSFSGHLLFEPWQVATGQGAAYKVFTPFWKALRGRDPGAPLAAPAQMRPPAQWPESDDPESWAMGAAMQRAEDIVRRHSTPGGAAAGARLAAFCDGPIARYHADRDVPARAAGSGLSEALSLGEISPRTVWAAGWRALQVGQPGAETFLKELVWREFAHHLSYHSPTMARDSWRPEWEGFAWRGADTPQVLAWMQGRTGVDFVDAGMREMHATGRMHNRARMVAASYLTKHLLVDWRVGLGFFATHLTDWDPASNAMGWQWVAGCGPDAAPFFRIFNPETQAAKFDPDGAYRRRWIAEGQSAPGQDARDALAVMPRRWGLSAHDPRPAPIVDHRAARARALDAYAALRGAG